MHIVCNFGELVTCSYLGDTLQLAVAVDDWLLNVIFITNVFIPCFCRLSVFVSIKGNIDRKKKQVGSQIQKLFKPKTYKNIIKNNV